jgi:hypothetical protein
MFFRPLLKPSPTVGTRISFLAGERRQLCRRGTFSSLPSQKGPIVRRLGLGNVSSSGTS